MLKVIYILEVLALIAFNIVWICRTDNKKVKYMLISVISLLVCGVITFISEGIGIYSFFITVIVALFNIITLYDIKTRYIPNILLIVLNITGLITSFFVPNGIFIASILGAWVITGLCFLIGKKAKNGIGTGDLYCMSGLMMSMNFNGIMNFMFSSLFLSLIYGVGTVILRKKTMKSEMAFAPFLLCGYLVMILCN